MKRDLFLCTGNSCRSQMAEAIVNARPGSAWRASSAGTAPASFVHPMKHLPFDLGITVCDSAAASCQP